MKRDGIKNGKLVTNRAGLCMMYDDDICSVIVHTYLVLYGLVHEVCLWCMNVFPNQRSALSGLVDGICVHVSVFPNHAAISLERSCRWDVYVIYLCFPTSDQS